MQQPSDEIKAKLDIVDVIRDYIPLKPAGMNFRANCPFHREKTPSFMVSPDKQIWHCFGCGKGGDIFSFVTEIEGISFVEALRMLAPKAGVTLKRQDPKVVSQRNKALDIIDLSRKYFHHILRTNKEAEAAREYLQKRGLIDETIEEWQIGYSLNSWDGLLKTLLSRGYKEAEIFLSGMIIKKEGTGRFYDRFRDRIMFPITDVNANTVAFTARVNPANEETEKMGKYINSPQTVVYDKSNILFGLDKAKMEIKKQDLAIIVEGQMDVITAHQAGYKNVVASSGTALTTEQVALIKRFTQNISLAFDQDQAGEMAADRGIREAMQAEMNIKVIEIPEGKDPDDCIKNNKDDWERAVKEAKPMMQYYFDKTFPTLDIKNPEGKREAVKILLPTIMKLGSNIEEDFWLKKLAEKIDVPEMLLRETMQKTKEPEKYKKNEVKKEVEPVVSKHLSREEKLSELLLALALKFPDLLEYLTNSLQIDQIVGAENRSIYKSLVFYYNNIISNQLSEIGNSQVIDYYGFKNWLQQEAQTDLEDQLRNLDKLVILADKEFFELELEAARNQAALIKKELNRYYLKNRMREIEKMIVESEKAGNKQVMDDMLNEFKNLSEELGRLGE